MATITKRGKNFRIKVSLGYDMNGKQIIKSTTFTAPDGTTPKKAEKLAQQYAFEFEQHCKGFVQLNESMSFSELADWYFENYAPVELKESTAYSYKGQYNKHIAPVLGNVKVKDITTPKLTQIMLSYRLNPATVRKIYIVIQSIFHRGVEQGFIRESPCRNVILPKIAIKRSVLFWMSSRQEIFLPCLKPSRGMKMSSGLSKCFFTGMRCGECLALSWEDIDFENMIISINHNLADVGGKHYLTTPKTESSIRTIGMSDALAEIFIEQKKYIEELSSAIGSSFAHPEMVFTSALGNYRDRNSLNTSFKRFLKGTGYEFLTLHQLRHCNATLLLNSGVDLKIVSEHLGHCDIGVTANIYADVLKSTKTKVADLISLKLS